MTQPTVVGGPTRPASRRIIPPGDAGWPAMAGWLEGSPDALGTAIVMRLFRDLLICEEPPSSNRGARIDAYNTRAGAPLGSYWCASFLACVWDDAGAETPGYGLAPSCDEWVRYAKREGLWVPKTERPKVGNAVLYGTPTDAHHIGCIVRTAPILRATTTTRSAQRRPSGSPVPRWANFVCTCSIQWTSAFRLWSRHSTATCIVRCPPGTSMAMSTSRSVPSMSFSMSDSRTLAPSPFSWRSISSTRR